MRKYLYILSLLVISTMAFGQRSSNQTIKNLKVDKKSKLINDVTIGSSSFEASAILTITSTAQGMLTPRMNTTARDNISSPADGLLIFNTTTNQFEFFETTWQAVGDGNGIYDGNGSLNGVTTVTQGTNKLSFTADPVNAFSVDGTTFSVDASNNRVGIGTIAPTARLHTVGINAAASSFSFLAEDNAGTDIFSIENNGAINILGYQEYGDIVPFPTSTEMLMFQRNSEGVIKGADNGTGVQFSIRNDDNTKVMMQFLPDRVRMVNAPLEFNTTGLTGLSTITPKIYGDTRLVLKGGTTGITFHNQDNSTVLVFFDDDGDVGIGIGGSDPTSKLEVNGDIEIGNVSSAFYLGDPTIDGTWRIIRSGDDLLMQQREAGVYNTKQTISGA